MEGGGIYFVCFHFPFFSDPSPSLKKMRGVFFVFFFHVSFFSVVSRFVSPLCFPMIPVATNPVALVALPCRVEVPEPVEKIDDLGLEPIFKKKYFQKIDLYTDIFLIIAIKKIVKNITVMVSDQ